MDICHKFLGDGHTLPLSQTWALLKNHLGIWFQILSHGSLPRVSDSITKMGVVPQFVLQQNPQHFKCRYSKKYPLIVALEECDFPLQPQGMPLLSNVSPSALGNEVMGRQFLTRSIVLSKPVWVSSIAVAFLCGVQCRERDWHEDEVWGQERIKAS